jgi:cyclic lactone autoinducer peptide
MLAKMLAVASVESFCFFWTHQPDVPEELMKHIHRYKTK